MKTLQCYEVIPEMNEERYHHHIIALGVLKTQGLITDGVTNVGYIKKQINEYRTRSLQQMIELLYLGSKITEYKRNTEDLIITQL